MSDLRRGTGSNVNLPRPCPPDRVPQEGETIYSGKIHARSRADYKIDTATGCWVWQKSLLKNGYPSGRGKPHRLYFQRANPTVDIAGLALFSHLWWMSSTMTAQQAADHWGVSRSAIAHIQTRQTWIGIGPERPLVNCGWCGEPITEGNRNRRYCNELHKVRAQRAKKHKPSPERWQINE